MDGAVPFRRQPVVPKEGTGLRALTEDTPVAKELQLIRVDDDRCPFPGVQVPDQKPIGTQVLLDGMDQAQMAAAFPTLMAFERQIITLWYRGYSHIPLKTSAAFFVLPRSWPGI